MLLNTRFSLILFILLSLASCQNGQFSKSNPAADLVFESTEHDFGDIPQNTPVEYTFTFTNKGQSPIVLNDVKSSCGCTIPQWPKEPIKSEETKSIMVSFNAKNEGLFRKAVSVYADGMEEAIKLRIRGTVVADTLNTQNILDTVLVSE